MKQKAIVVLAGVLLVILGAALAYGFLSLLYTGSPVEDGARINQTQGTI